MKTHALFLFAALAPLGCASPVATSIYDYQAPADQTSGGGGSSSAGDPASNGGGMEASTCGVQGHASVSGVTLAAQDAIEVFDPTIARFTFRITDYADACAAGIGMRASSNVISIEYDHASLSSGTYDITQTAGMSASLAQYDATCHATEQKADSGTVTFDRLDDCGGVGSLDLVFGGSHVTATFTASVCSAPGGGSGACE